MLHNAYMEVEQAYTETFSGSLKCEAYPLNPLSQLIPDRKLGTSTKFLWRKKFRPVQFFTPEV